MAASALVSARISGILIWERFRTGFEFLQKGVTAPTRPGG